MPLPRGRARSPAVRRRTSALDGRAVRAAAAAEPPPPTRGGADGFSGERTRHSRPAGACRRSENEHGLGRRRRHRRPKRRRPLRPPPRRARRITTRGIGLNTLVGRRFWVGEVLCAGTRLCEPCQYLADLTDKPLIHPLVPRGVLRAEIL